jgi:predicted anti-sigma-YlaC factor YlaD
MTCQETIGLLAEFLDQTLGPGAVADLEAHLRGCEACRSYTNTYRATRELVGQAGRMAMPAELKARLRAFLLDQLAK